MSKKQSIIIVTIFCVFIFGVGILTLLQPYEDFSESENRYLKKFPKLTLENIETDAYMKSIDEYLSDHIIFRKYWVQLKSLNELLLGKQENHNIYFAKDNYLIKKLENIDEVKLERNSNYLKKFSENNQNVFVGIIPTDEYILKDKLLILYLIYTLIGTIAMSTALGLKMLTLTNYFNFNYFKYSFKYFPVHEFSFLTSPSGVPA